MPFSTHGAVRRGARLVAWPVLRTVRCAGRWRRGQIYGMRPPAWWPERFDGWLGPRSPHDNKRVVIFAGADRYEFAPAASGPYRGHVHHGAIRPDAAAVAGCLARQRLPVDAARTLAAVSSFEGGFDSIQTWDRGKFAWGFIQFTATGGLPRLMQTLKAGAPEVFAACFETAGIDVGAGGLTIRLNGRVIAGRRVHNRLHDDPQLWRWFLLASRRQEVQDAQVRAAYEGYYAHPLTITVPIGGRDVALRTLLAGDEYGRAVVCDRAVNRGVGHTIALFRNAVRWSRARRLEDAPAIIEWVRAAESHDAVRLDTLERLLTTGS